MSTDLATRFEQAYPGKFFLSPSIQGFEDYLKTRNWLFKNEIIDSIESAGEGNMNCFLRVRTNQRSFIAKQARPWVEKYPQIDAPVERSSVEVRYFELVGGEEGLRNHTPGLIGTDPENFIMMVSDLGGEPYAYLYEGDKKLTEEDLQSIMAYISRLHCLKPVDFPGNRAMRVLNHEHIFHFPFAEDNGFDLDSIQPGLQEVSLSYKRNDDLKSRIETLGKLYLGEGKCLVHGDYYPGSWLNTDLGFKVIDPEFGHIGYPEFDLGVMIAHLSMTGHEEEIPFALEMYNSDLAPDDKLISGFAGTEILRRLLGVAQLPLNLCLDHKKGLLDQASEWVLKGMMKYV